MFCFKFIVSFISYYLVFEVQFFYFVGGTYKYLIVFCVFSIKIYFVGLWCVTGTFFTLPSLTCPFALRLGHLLSPLSRSRCSSPLLVVAA